MTKNFVLIGAAGYIAPKHIQAITDTGNRLVAVCDPHDSVGILDRYDFNCKYFKEFERFDRFCEKVKGTPDQIDYVSICSPNYLHDAHIRFGLRIGADVICEKPLVINPWNLDALEKLEAKSGNRVWSILQLRLNPDLQVLKTKLIEEQYKCKITYHTPRGDWYFKSWKGDEEKSGGLLINIGIHLFDLIIWLFGKNVLIGPEIHTTKNAYGYMVFEKCNFWYDLSINDRLKSKRVFSIGKNLIELSNNFTNLHTKSYKEILEGRGFGINDVRPAIEFCYKLRKNKKDV